MPDYKKQKPDPKGGGRRPEGQRLDGSYFLSNRGEMSVASLRDSARSL